LLLVCCWEYTKSDTIFELSRGTKAYKDIICGVFFNGILPKQTTRREGARKQ